LSLHHASRYSARKKQVCIISTSKLIVQPDKRHVDSGKEVRGKE